MQPQMRVDGAIAPTGVASVAALAGRVLENVERVVVGKRGVAELLLVALLAEGHVLIEDVPGVGKTTLARAMARSIGGEFRRIQFTPDLLPTDIGGLSYFDQKVGDFRFRPGPVFANVVLADEINRATPRTQSALLEAMEERQVTIDGERHPLAEPFMVLATQNPVEYEGTYPLPEAQLDRFMFKVLVSYPPEAAEQEVLRRYHAGFDAHDLEAAGLEPLVRPAALPALRAEITAVVVEQGIIGYITAIAAASRRSPDLILGGSPRASIALIRLLLQARFAGGEQACLGHGEHTIEGRQQQNGEKLGHRRRLCS